MLYLGNGSLGCLHANMVFYEPSRVGCTSWLSTVRQTSAPPLLPRAVQIELSDTVQSELTKPLILSLVVTVLTHNIASSSKVHSFTLSFLFYLIPKTERSQFASGRHGQGRVPEATLEAMARSRARHWHCQNPTPMVLIIRSVGSYSSSAT